MCSVGIYVRFMVHNIAQLCLNYFGYFLILPYYNYYLCTYYTYTTHTSYRYYYIVVVVFIIIMLCYRSFYFTKHIIFTY